MRAKAAPRVAAALAATLAAAVAVAILPAAGRAAETLSGRWSGSWVDLADGFSVPVTIAIDPQGGTTVEATVTYRMLSGRPFDRRFLGSQRGGTARFDMGDGQYLICGLDADGRLRVRITNPRSTTALLLEPDPGAPPEPEGSSQAVAAPEAPVPPPAPAASAPAPAEAPPEQPAESAGAPGIGSEAGIWSGSWRQGRMPLGAGPIRIEIADAGGGMRHVEAFGIAGLTEPTVVSERQLRAEGLVFPIGPGRDLVVMRGYDGGLQLRLSLPDTVLMTMLTKEGAVPQPPPAALSAARDPGAAPVAEPAEEPLLPAPRTVADLPRHDLPLRPDLVLPGPVTAGDARAEAYAGIWVGHWDDGREAALVIADVTATGARLLYVTPGEAPGGDALSAPGFDEVSLQARFGGDVLEFADGGAAYRFMRTGREVADATANGIPGRAYGIFMRAWHPPLVPAAQPDPAPDASADPRPVTASATD